MRMITGALLLLTAEQAFAHAHMVGFPHDVFVRKVCMPTSAALGVLGVGILIWGLLTERRGTRANDSGGGDSGAGDSEPGEST